MNIPKTSTEEIFSAKEKEEIITRIFLKKKTDSSFLFKGNGGEYYDKIIHSVGYTAYDKEMTILKDNAKNISPYLTKNITDIGCGNGEKICALLKDNNHRDEINYIAADYSAEMITIAENTISKVFPHLKFGNHQIMREGNSLFTENLDNNTYLRLGGTIGNFPQEEIINQLQKMNNKGIVKGNAILFSYFQKPTTQAEIEATKRMYKNKEAEDFVFNGLKNIGIDTDYFDQIVEYDPQDACVYVGVQAKTSYTIVRKGWDDIHIAAGEKFYIHQSKRFTQEEIDTILHKAGAKKQKQISQGGVSLVIAKKDPKYYKKALKIVILSSLLLAGVLGGKIGYMISEKHQKEKQEQASDEVLKKSLQNKEIRVGWNNTFDIKKSPGDKLKVLKASTDAIYNYFVQVYGIGNISESDLKLQIKNELRKGDNLNGVNENIDNSTLNYQKFISDVFIPQNESILQGKGISLIPFASLQEYQKVFETSSMLKGTLKIRTSQYPMLSGGDPVFVDESSPNIDKMLPRSYTISTNRLLHKNDTLGRRLEKSSLRLQDMGNFISTHGTSYTVYKVQLNLSSQQTIDVVLFGRQAGTGPFDNVLELSPSLAQEFLDHWAVKK